LILSGAILLSGTGPKSGEAEMKLSARNKLAGTIAAIDKGAVNATVTIDLGGGSMVTAMITNASVEELGLVVGKTAYAVVKASDVIVGVD
jgi:molybdopterin-binding protein